MYKRETWDSGLYKSLQDIEPVLSVVWSVYD